MRRAFFRKSCPVFLLAALCLPGAAAAGKPAVAPAAVPEVAARADAPIILDVRSQAEYDAGHVPGAVLIPHDQLAARLSELDRDRWVLVYCKSGRRAGIAERILAQDGFDVRQIEGSWLRWQAEDLPVATPATPEAAR
ncbi:rhodanese-like domain-containing protein [Arenimonas daejeonensis]|uniref:rhodanese-like domain-containing protein n=1 Tax=Arenimonas daejeonensis TaxID=370777 RepID=UPI0011BD4B1E|nr:rhodanese-like domain-containing protein [Arenimonas daejeonensis]